ncbi:hypothetical protein E4U56_006834, partial [Claviceps arundinis]
LVGDQLQSSGGRVIAVNSVGESLRSAVDASYAALSAGVIKFDDMFFRKDIAHRAFRAPKKEAMAYAQPSVDIH